MNIENRHLVRRGSSAWSLAMAVVIGIAGVAGSAVAHAQATAGNVFGTAPAGQTVTAKSLTNGLSRHVTVDAKGRYNIGALPVGMYTVTLEKDGTAVLQHNNVPLTVGRGVKVDFPCPQNQCAGSNQ
ncbi:carboxypeptidase-like regulatory domain-containing protein [Rhodanobacter umsongensis]|uniref:Carboxypeptidase-like regulatory domain-containing protein n=1 Tax=Rhodanobacter umsongensis TaxID=633153 RepID=A0ABW0JGX3_9GAMM